MKEIIVDRNGDGKRVDKYLSGYLDAAPVSFFYKMFRKKNITLNGKKIEGSEHLKEGDSIKLFLSDETIDGFRTKKPAPAVRPMSAGHGPAGTARPRRIPVVYEDADLMIVNKPAGVLSQRAQGSEESLNEILLRQLYAEGKVTEQSLSFFRPSVLNRLDRNTSGMVLYGKSLPGSREISDCLKKRTLRKYYLCLVRGKVTAPGHEKAYLSKDETQNTVRIFKTPEPDTVPVETAWKPLAANDTATVLQVELITGKSHQIRAHLASLGMPVGGDTKYGDCDFNRKLADRYAVRSQLLHAWSVTFPALPALPAVSKKTFTCPVPQMMERAVLGEGLWLPGIPVD